MRCKYREQIHVCGQYLEADIFPVFHHGQKRGRRRARYQPTKEVQARLNQRNAERMLTRLLNLNFGKGDIELTLTYRDDTLPDTREEADKQVAAFIRRIKRKRARLGLDELKYVQIYGGGRHHYHIVMNGGIPREDIEGMWGLGYANTKSLIPDPQYGFGGLAVYIAQQLIDSSEFEGEDLFSMFDINEETGELIDRENAVRKKGKRRWSCSKNLKRPEPEVHEGRISQRRIEELATFDSGTRLAWETLYPGYTFVDAMPYHNGENGGYYITVRMVKKE
jgi:hypothetical protein